MQNDKFYTFLLSHSLKSKIYIRRVRVSKSLLHFSALGVFLGVSLSVLAVGITGVVNSPTIAQADSAQPTAQLSAQVSQTTDKIDYSRPGSTENIAINSGGPAVTNGLEMSDEEVENRLKVIQTTADPVNLPTIWAHMGKINNEFGFRRNPFGGRTYEFHAGMDIDGDRGDLVVAPANGTVIKAGWQGGYGNMVEVDHGNGLTTRYGHLSRIEVEVGEPVRRGQLMALVGSTGRSTGPHLHYELRLHDKPINPRRFLPPEPMEIRKING